MREPGIDEVKLLDGACIVDVLVEAPADQVAAALGEPVKLAEGGAIVDGVELSGIGYYAAAWNDVGWSLLEGVDEPTAADDDYIVTMLNQAAAALRGQVLDLPRAYANGLGTARDAARALGTRAVVVWGSDEWYALGGGAEFDAAGQIVRACSVADQGTLTKAEQDRNAMDEDSADFDEDDDDDSDSELIHIYAPGREVESLEADTIEYLDGWFKELGAVQPLLPASLLEHAATEFDQVWGARAPQAD